MNDAIKAWHLRGNWTPLREKHTHTNLRVKGHIPPELKGVYMRTGTTHVVRHAGARLGVMPRNGTAKDVRWFEVDPCYVFHPVNAFDNDGIITMFVSRQESAFSGNSNEFGNVGRLWRWQIDLNTGAETEIDDRPGDFGRTDDRLVGQDSRYGYIMALGGEGNSKEPVYGDKLYKYDLHNGAGEDEGWILNLKHDVRTGKSRMVIIDAQNFSAAPVATIHLPERIPYGAHGNWFAD